MRTINQILESIENKKKELTEDDKKYFGCDDLQQAIPKSRYGGFPIRGFNAPFNPYEVTEHLSNEEFKVWYNYNQRTLWKEIKDTGVEEIKCLDCDKPIEKPEDIVRWAGIVRDGNCFVASAETGKIGITDFSKPFYERLKRVVFEK